MKKITLIFLLTLSVNVFSQENKTVTLVTSGQGKSPDEAKFVALRNAIEQAFGAFVSSKTEILNDELIKDEIVSISNGNIQKYSILSEILVPNGLYSTSIEATVSITNLQSFVKSKGFEVEFSGGLFGANLKQQKLNENAEFSAIQNLCIISNELLKKSLDYSLEIEGPKVFNSWQNKSSTEINNYSLLFKVKCSVNENFDLFEKNFRTVLSAISMKQFEVNDYKSLEKKIFILTENDSIKYYFRSPNSAIAIQNLFLKSNQYLHNFVIQSEIDTINVIACCNSFSYDIPNFQNIHEHQGENNSWNLNFPEDENYAPGRDYSPTGGVGFPIFSFPNATLDISSWYVYMGWLKCFREDKFWFNSENYYSLSSSDLLSDKYEKFLGSMADHDVIIFPGTTHYDRGHSYRDNRGHSYRDNPKLAEEGDAVHYVGNIDYSKTEYYSKFLAVYPEEKLALINKIEIKGL